MNLNRLRAKRAQQARAAVAGSLGALRAARSDVARIVLRWAPRQKTVRAALAQYATTIEDDDELSAPDMSSTTALELGRGLVEKLDEVRDELAALFAELKDQERELVKRKAKPTRLERHETKRAKAKAKARARP